MVTTPAAVQSDRPVEMANREIEMAGGLCKDVLSADRRLESWQNKIESEIEKITEDDINAIKQDVSSASSLRVSWKAEMARLEGSYSAMRELSRKPSTAERGQLQGPLDELQRLLDALPGRIAIVNDRVMDLLDRVMYLQVRH